VTESKSVLIAEIISLVAAVIVVEWLAARLTHRPGLEAILIYVAIRVLVGVVIRFRSRPSRR
jgi:hypothetical protein